MSTQLFYTTIKRKSSVNGEAFRIANGATTSNVLAGKKYLFGAEALVLFAPATLAETVTIQISPDYDEDYAGNVITAGAWSTLNDSANVAVKTPTAGNSIIYNGTLTGYAGIRLVAGGAVAADRDYFVRFEARA